VVVDDPAVAPHHLLVTVASAASGQPPSIRLLDLAGGCRTDIDGVPLSGEITVAESVRSGRDGPPGAGTPGFRSLRVRLGGSELVLFVWDGEPCVRADPLFGLDELPQSRLVPSATDRGRFIVERPFQSRSPVSDVDQAVRGALGIVDVPELPSRHAGPPTTALTGAVVALVGASIVARLLGSLMFLVFAGVAAGVAAGSYLAGWWVVLRHRRRARRRWEADLLELDGHLADAVSRAAAAMRRSSPGVWPALSVIGADDVDRFGGAAPALWQSRWEGAEIDVVVGWGDRPWQPIVGEAVDTVRPHDTDEAVQVEQRLASIRLGDVPLLATIRRAAATAVSGPGRLAVARSVVVQLAWHVGPADVSIVVVTDRPRAWSWVRRLPHAAESTGSAVVETTDLERGPGAFLDRITSTDLWVVVLDATRDSVRDQLVRDAVEANGAALIVVAERAPAWVESEARSCATGSLVVRRSDGPDDVRGTLVGLSGATAERVAAWLSALIDPESRSAGWSDRCSFADVHAAVEPRRRVDPFDSASIIDGWRSDVIDPIPAATIGLSPGGTEWVDLERQGPHALVAGTTGSGKSELLRTLVTGLAVRSAPEHLALLLVDYKGGAAFDACADLPHVVGVVTDLDHDLAARALRSLDAELHQRERLMRAVGASDLGEYRSAIHDLDGGRAIARLVIVVDEFASLAKELPEFLASLVDIGRRGRSLGVHLVLATQRPGGVVSEDLRANTGLRIALRVNTPAESNDVIGVPDASSIDRSCPGRAVVAVDGGRSRSFQTGCCTMTDGGIDSELSVVVDAIRRAVTLGGFGLAATPWCAPLPASIGPDELAPLLESGGPAQSSAEDRVVDRAVPIGAIDDPDAQCRRALTWSPGDGSLAVIGRFGSGTTSTLLSVVAAACAAADPDATHVYVIDAIGDHRLDALTSVAHCAGVVRPIEAELLRRMIDRLSVNDRTASSPRTVLVIDGLEALRSTLREGPDPSLEREVMDLLGSASDRGVELLVSARRELGGLRSAFRDVWVGAVDDPTAARALGWRGRDADGFAAGRVGLVSCQLEGQVALGAPGLAELPSVGGPERLARLPSDLSFAALDERIDSGRGSTTDDRQLVIGLDIADLAPTGPEIGPHRHLLVVGRPGGGVSTTLAAIQRRWRRQVPDGRVVDIGTDGAVASTGSGTAPELWVVDDADRVRDDDGLLAAIIDGSSSQADRVVVVAGIRSDAHRQAFGHWTRGLAAAERGIALAASGEPPTDVFGSAAPRRSLVEQRPGLGWYVEAGMLRGIQIAR